MQHLTQLSLPPFALSRARNESYSTMTLYEDIDTRTTIRILKLEAGTPGDRLRATLVNVSLNLREQAYEALSYEWGQSRSSRTIDVGGHRLSITDNMYSALAKLRRISSPRYLWVDALCINQENCVEKSKQIALMRDIYAKARMVIVWLGPSTEHSSIGMKIIRHLAGDKALIGEHTPWIAISASTVRAGLEDILLRGYWSRKWVIQENAVARRINLQCGQDWVAWDSEHLARRFLLRAKFAEISLEWDQAGLRVCDLKPIIDHLEMQIQIGGSRQPILKLPLLDLVHRFRHREVTESQDALYALLGLAPAGVMERFQPDYNKSADEVFRDFLDEIQREHPQVEGSISELVEILNDDVREYSMAAY